MSDYLRANKWTRRHDGKWTHASIANAYTQQEAERMQKTVDALMRCSPPETHP